MKNIKENNNDEVFINLNPKCEPQLDKRNLYHTIGSQIPSQGGKKIVNQFALLWVLNYSDGMHSLYDIAQLSGYDFVQIKMALGRLNIKRMRL